MKKKRNWILCGALCVVLIGATAGFTMAYLSAHDTKVNVVGIGHNDTEITEEFPDPTPVEPGKDNTYSKKVSVTNKTSVPCYIRALVVFSNSDIGKAATLEGLNRTDWEYVAEGSGKLGGYYYYKSVVDPGKTTKNLFTGVKIGAGADYSANPEDFEVLVYEESVNQSSHTSYQDAWNAFLRE